MSMGRTYKSSDYYYWYKENKICVNCGKETALQGKTMCLMCQMDKRERNKVYYLSLSVSEREEHNQSSAKKKQWCRENGICYNCYKRPAAENRMMCGICLAKKREKAKERRIANGATPRDMLGKYGRCYFCNKPAIKGKKTCAECRERCISHLPEKTDTSNHIWRKLSRADVARIEYNKVCPKR